MAARIAHARGVPARAVFNTSESASMPTPIEASRTRPYLIRSLELLKTKHEERPLRKHGNIPL